MDYFATFSRWLDALLVSYVSHTASSVAAALEPAVVTVAVLYVMIWGYLQLSGRIQEPAVDAVKRFVVLAVVIGVSLQLWLYNEVIVDTFFSAPARLAAVVVGADDSVRTVDEIIDSGTATAEMLLSKGGILDFNLSFYFAGFLVYLIVGLTAVYTIFLLSLAKVALAILLAIGPLLVPLAFFESTKRFFESWLAQLANYAFVAILTVLIAALMLHVLAAATRQAIDAGPSIQISQAVQVCMTAILTLLVMRQVLPMAAGISSGLSLTTFGVVSSTLGWGASRLKRSAGDLMRGLLFPRTHPREGLSYIAGAALRRAVEARVARRW